MISANYYHDNPDLGFTLNQLLDWQTIVPLVEEDFADADTYAKTGEDKFAFAPADVDTAVENYRLTIEQVGELVGKEVAPIAQAIEAEGLKLVDGKVHYPEALVRAMQTILDAGVVPYATERKYGGLQLPYSVQIAAVELAARAHQPISHVMVCFNAAEVIAKFADEDLIQKYVPKMTAGDMTGAMAFTEPNFGSDLKNILTKAEPNEDGTWSITGTKRFITHACGFADKPSAILTLARSGGSGAKGLSFFLVESTDVEIAKLEDKMGQHTSPTCEVVFDGAKAHLIGQEGAGLVKYAMAMMNAARLSVAAQAVGCATAALREAENYAAQRVQFGKTIEDIPAVARLIGESRAYEQGMRALVYRTAEVVDLLDGYTGKGRRSGLDERAVRRQEEVRKNDRLAKFLTPVSKLFATEKVNTIGYNCLQVFGGSGYTEEYDIARIVRDMRIGSIYEGTSQLQVVAIIGSLVEGLRPGGIVLEFLNEELKELESSSNAKSLKALKAFSDSTAELVGLMEEYKQLDKYSRDYLAWDIVFGFSYLLAAILLEKQCVALEKLDNLDFLNQVEQSVPNTPQTLEGFRAQKRQVSDDLFRMMKSQLAVTAVRIKSGEVSSTNPVTASHSAQGSHSAKGSDESAA